MIAMIAAVAGFAQRLPSYAPAFACTPPPGGLPHYTVADHVKAAPIVLEGVATAITMGSSTELEVASIQVRRYYKGIGPAVVSISGFGADMACLSPVNVGDHLIIYAKGDPNAGLSAYYLSQFDAVAPADTTTIAQVQAVVGQGQPPLGPGADGGSTGNTSGIALGAAALGFAAFGFIAGVIVGAAVVLFLKRR